MENKDPKETGRLTPEQIDAVVRISGEISVIKHVLKNIHPENGYKKHVVFHSGFLPVAVASHKNTDIRDLNGDPIPTIVDAQFLEMITSYFTDKRNHLVEDLEKVINGEGGAQ